MKWPASTTRPTDRPTPLRAGVATVDLMLVFMVVLPMMIFVSWAAPRIMRLSYEMFNVLVMWPFM